MYNFLACYKLSPEQTCLPNLKIKNNNTGDKNECYTRNYPNPIFI